MSAIDQKNLLEIIAINVQSGTSKKTGQPFSIPKAQCVLRATDGNLQVGELMLPKEMAETRPGRYLAEFVLAVDFDRRIVPRITALHPVDTGAKASPQPQSKVAA